jgi:hypothetical protein
MLIRSEPSMALSSPTFFNNSVSVAQSYVLTANTAKDFVLQGLSQPYDMGTHPLYIFELEDKTAKNVVAKTFPNLINRNPANYQTTEVLIKVNNEQYLSTSLEPFRMPLRSELPPHPRPPML